MRFSRGLFKNHLIRFQMKDKTKIKIEDLGYNEFFESNRKKLGLSVFSVARVTSEYKESYRVKNQSGEYLAKITGKLDEAQYSNFITLKKEAEFYEMDKLERREKDRQFGKFIKKAKKELKDIGHKN